LKTQSAELQSGIIEKAKQGNYQAFEELMKHYRDRVFRLAYQLCGNKDDALDVCQEVFVKLFQSLKSYNSDYKFESWLYRIVSNAVIDAHRRSSRHKGGSLDAFAEQSNFEVTDKKTGPAEKAQTKELALMFRKVAELLPPNQRIVFVLKDLEGASSAEVAEAIQATEATVRSHLHAARKKIKETIENRYPEFLEGFDSES